MQRCPYLYEMKERLLQDRGADQPLIVPTQQEREQLTRELMDSHRDIRDAPVGTVVKVRECTFKTKDSHPVTPFGWSSLTRAYFRRLRCWSQRVNKPRNHDFCFMRLLSFVRVVMNLCSLSVESRRLWLANVTQQTSDGWLRRKFWLRVSPFVPPRGIFSQKRKVSWHIGQTIQVQILNLTSNRLCYWPDVMTRGCHNCGFHVTYFGVYLQPVLHHSVFCLCSVWHWCSLKSTGSIKCLTWFLLNEMLCLTFVLTPSSCTLFDVFLDLTVIHIKFILLDA